MNKFNVIDISIILTDNKVKYQSGDCVCGKVIIIVDGKLPYALIKINLDCIAEVMWVDLPGFKSEGHKVHVKRKYLEYKYDLPECM